MLVELLAHYLQPLQAWLDDPSINEIMLNQPQQVFIETAYGIEQHQVPELTQTHLSALVTSLARQTDCHLTAEQPLLATTLASGHRLQIVIPPACSHEQLCIAIRRIGAKTMSLTELAETGCFNQTKLISRNLNKTPTSHESYPELLQDAVATKKNIIIAGATGSGKTTLLNACLQSIPEHERIITLEDVREINIPHANRVHLLTRSANASAGAITMQTLLHTSLRLRPDRIIMGEMRGAEAWDFCHLIASGHPGTLATVHANSVELALQRLVQLMQLNLHNSLSATELLTQLQLFIDIVVYIERCWDGECYKRQVLEILV